MVGDKIWMKRNDVAEILGCKKPHKVVNDHVPDKFNSTLGALMVTPGPPSQGSPTTPPYIYEAGLYKLIFKFQTEAA